MNNLRNTLEIRRVLERKVKKLEKIALNWEKNPEMSAKAERFLSELEDVEDFMEEGVILLQRNSFEKKLRDADESEIEYDGEFCKVAVIYNYPFNNGQWIIYTAAVSSL